MLIVTVKLKRPGESKTEKIGIMHITNDGTGTKAKGNYEIVYSSCPTQEQIRAGTCGPEWTLEWQAGIVGELKGFKRRLSCWYLVAACLNKMLPKDIPWLFADRKAKP